MNGSTDSLLLPYQRRWIEDPAEWKIAEKSRRTGLTWAEAVAATLAAAKARNAGGPTPARNPIMRSD